MQDEAAKAQLEQAQAVRAHAEAREAAHTENTETAANDMDAHTEAKAAAAGAVKVRPSKQREDGLACRWRGGCLTCPASGLGSTASTG